MDYILEIDINDEFVMTRDAMHDKFGFELPNLTINDTKEDIEFVLETAISGDYRLTTTMHDMTYWADIAWRRYLDKVMPGAMSYSQIKETIPNQKGEYYLKALIYFVLVKIYYTGALSKFDWVSLKIERMRGLNFPWALDRLINNNYYRVTVNQTSSNKQGNIPFVAEFGIPLIVEGV